jgi:hypothetical protein
MSHMMAHFPLDFLGTQSVIGAKESVMAQNPPVISMQDFLKCIRERLDEAAAIAKAAEICAEAGKLNRAVTIVLDVEHLVYDVNTFLNAASMINRMSKS